MPVVATTSVSLRFSDKSSDSELVPEALTAALGTPPTGSMTKGEVIVRKGRVLRSSDGTALVARFSTWNYSVERREPGDINGQIRELFGGLTQDLSVWRALSANYNPDLFVGMFMKEENEGIDISAECLCILSDRGVSLGLDIYGPSERSDE